MFVNNFLVSHDIKNNNIRFNLISHFYFIVVEGKDAFHPFAFERLRKRNNSVSSTSSGKNLFDRILIVNYIT